MTARDAAAISLPLWIKIKLPCPPFVSLLVLSLFLFFWYDKRRSCGLTLPGPKYQLMLRLVDALYFIYKKKKRRRRSSSGSHGPRSIEVSYMYIHFPPIFMTPFDYLFSCFYFLGPFFFFLSSSPLNILLKGASLTPSRCVYSLYPPSGARLEQLVTITLAYRYRDGVIFFFFFTFV